MNPTVIPGICETPIDKVFARVNHERRSPSSFVREFKLDTIRLILSRLNNPHEKLNVIHIAGTKGKGSTASFVARIGTELGLKTGIYSSPHFERYTERFSINNQEVSEPRLNAVLAQVLTVVEQIDQEIANGQIHLPPATFFDISTSAAFLLFCEEQVDLVALEVGLGGRLDSTNVCRSIATVITSISKDHTRLLGNKTTDIAKEKAAIIKSPVPSICGLTEDPVFQVISRRAQSQGSTLHRLDADFGPRNLTANSFSELTFDYVDPKQNQNFKSLQINLLGEHQAYNAALAIKSITEVLPKLGLDSPSPLEPAVRRALMSISLKGRLEVISSQPLLIADMAHNQASIAALVSCLEKQLPDCKSQAIFSCSKDKDYESMLRPLIGYFDRLILTEFQNNPRAQELGTLQQKCHQLNVEKLSVECLSSTTPAKALQKAMADSEKFELTVACGSIFLVGEILTAIESAPAID
ncbi:MAG: folylpolyglutamate synthase/dihydrofolate synthase family protein [Planctomycetota bacterium]|nr:folylpolyglutamate synthase/dihydrofolate synthase family protein [Planctomycetota bacterium]